MTHLRSSLLLSQSSATLIFVLRELLDQFATGESLASALPPNCSPFVPALAFGPGLKSAPTTLTAGAAADWLETLAHRPSLMLCACFCVRAASRVRQKRAACSREVNSADAHELTE